MQLRPKRRKGPKLIHYSESETVNNAAWKNQMVSYRKRPGDLCLVAVQVPPSDKGIGQPVLNVLDAFTPLLLVPLHTRY